jgi:hypothetical protein
MVTLGVHMIPKQTKLISTQPSHLLLAFLG